MTEFYRQYLAVAVFIGAALLMVGAMLTLARLLRPTRPQQEKYIAYEAGSDPVALFDAKHLITADPASFAAGTEVLRVPLNHRATFRWIANPGEELVWPATATNGLGLGVTAASILTFSGSVNVNEQ